MAKKTVDEFIAQAAQWGPELRRLREIVLTQDLAETVKWGAPCYTHAGKNVVGIVGFKAHFCLWFHQGSLLSDPSNVLINAQEGVTQAQRQWRMTDAAEIKPTVIKRYLKEAIALVQAGRSVAPRRGKPVVVPPELQAALHAEPALQEAFDALTVGPRREFAAYIADAKQAATRRRRIEKILPMLRAGRGLNDKYRRG